MNWNKKYYDDLWNRMWRRAARFNDLSSKIKPQKEFPDPRYLQIGEARSITGVVLFIDIVSFTARSERSNAKDLLLTLNLFLSEMTQIVSDWGGTIEKFTGDGLMAIFDTSYTDTQGMIKDAIDAATTMKYVITNPLNSYLATKSIEPIHFRIGIDGGNLIIGKLGIRSDNDPVTIGWSANIASKLQEISTVDGILISNFIYWNLPEWERHYAVLQNFPADWIYTKKGTTERYPFYQYTGVWKIPN